MNECHLALPYKRLNARLIDYGMLFVFDRLAIHVLRSLPATADLSYLYLVGNVFSMVIFLLINYRFFTHDGQSIGKRILGIKMVTLDNKMPSIWRSFILRELALIAIVQLLEIPIRHYYSPLEKSVAFVILLDCFFILRPGRRCIHDFLAGTQVVDIFSPVTIMEARFAKKWKSWGETSLSKKHLLQNDVALLAMYQPASRRERFFGYLADKVAIFVGFTLMYYLMRVSGIDANFGGDSLRSSLLMFGVCISSFLLINTWFLIESQQTLGKVLYKTKIISVKRGKISFFRIFFCRELLFWGPWSFGKFCPDFVVGLYYLMLFFNAIFIFREDRRCLHDWACGSRVGRIP